MINTFPKWNWRNRKRSISYH